MKCRLSVMILFCCLVSESLFAQAAFTIYNAGNSPLPDNSVKCITLDSLGRKWVGTSFGLAVYNDTNWTVYQTFNSGLSDNAIECVTFDDSGAAWIGTQNGGLNKFDGTSWTIFNTLNSGKERNR